MGGALEQHLDLDVVALGGLARHPAARLEVKILQIVVGPFALRFRASHLVRAPAPAALMYGGQVLKEQARALNQRRQCAIVISRQRIDASLDIGEVLPEQARHIRVELPAFGNGQIGMGRPCARSRAAAPRARAGA